MPLCKIEDAIEDIRQGKMVIMVDDEDRENEGDLIVAAEFVTPEIINFMATHGRGLICLPMSGEMIDRLELPLMASNNQSGFGTNFTVSIEARHGVATGISAPDRAKTVLAAVADDAKPYDIVTPGHIFPLRARDGGVLVRAGQTEGGVDIARLAGCKPAAVIVEVMNEDGTMARLPDLEIYAEKHDLKICSVADLIAYRMSRGQVSVSKVAESNLPTKWGEFTVASFHSEVDGKTHIALYKGDIDADTPALVRVHAECLLGDTLGSMRCDCDDQLHSAMCMIQAEERGVLLYMRQGDARDSVSNAIKSFALQDTGVDAAEADKRQSASPSQTLREYGVGAQMLTSLGVRKMRLMTNNPKKMACLQGYGLEVTERIPIEADACELNLPHLKAKKEQHGHLLELRNSNK